MELEGIRIQRLDLHSPAHGFDIHRRLHPAYHHTMGDLSIDKVDTLKTELIHRLAFNRRADPRHQLEEPRRACDRALRYHQVPWDEDGVE